MSYTLCLIFYVLSDICYLLYGLCYMLYVICYVLYVICYMLYDICYMLYVVCYMLYVTYYISFIFDLFCFHDVIMQSNKFMHILGWLNEGGKWKFLYLYLVHLQWWFNPPPSCPSIHFQSVYKNWTQVIRRYNFL